jgi:hypothetical protein
MRLITLPKGQPFAVLAPDAHGIPGRLADIIPFPSSASSLPSLHKDERFRGGIQKRRSNRSSQNYEETQPRS